ncbi:hypothetical protein PEL8287_00074 [Roseovarius litorisediminis]|uniref:Uncharacterized protein n=1 Tax=Roseovarius litorisediminis TaxID=1312363 RepID=A0A1Y5RA53_9RHOB|nr:hypothetical protein PEL8287_00074 [Roseovarius litorisediminis]
MRRYAEEGSARAARGRCEGHPSAMKRNDRTCRAVAKAPAPWGGGAGAARASRANTQQAGLL